MTTQQVLIGIIIALALALAANTYLAVKYQSIATRCVDLCCNL